MLEKLNQELKSDIGDKFAHKNRTVSRSTSKVALKARAKTLKERFEQIRGKKAVTVAESTINSEI